jgi:hypothetical protein
MAYVKKFFLLAQAGHRSMQQGWTGTMDQLDAYLANATKSRTR